MTEPFIEAPFVKSAVGDPLCVHERYEGCAVIKGVLLFVEYLHSLQYLPEQQIHFLCACLR